MSIRPSIFLCVLVHFSFGQCVPCPTKFGENFEDVQNLKRTSPDYGVRLVYVTCTYALLRILIGTYKFLILHLSSSHSLMSGVHESRPDYYWICSGSTDDVIDTKRMFTDKKCMKLPNNCCQTEIHRTVTRPFV